jgi:hypothetical protein
MHPKLAESALPVELITASLAGAGAQAPAILGEHPHPGHEEDEMSAGSPAEDSGGEPAPAEDPWARPADFDQPGSAAALPAEPAQQAPPAPEPGGFASPAPAAWSAPVDWTPSAPQTAQPGQPPPPPSWPGGTDPWSSQHAGGNGIGPASTDARIGQPPAPAPPAGPYSYPSVAYPTPSAVRTNRLAIAALVCGVAQFFLGLFALNFLLAVPAIICGAIGMRQTRERGEGGRGLSIAGLVLGILGIVWNVLYVVLIVVLTKVSSSSG